MNKVVFTFRDHLKEELKDPEFKKEWDKSEGRYQLACKIIEARLAKKMSQKSLARKINSTQAVISRLESYSSNPSFLTLEKIANALGKKLTITLT